MGASEKTQAKQAKRAEREKALADRIAEAEKGLADEKRRYAVILADPPWRWEPYSDVTGMDRAAENHYSTLPLERIKNLIPPTTKDSVLFLWAISSMLPQALDVMAAWGFTYKASAVWVKPSIGMGYWFRNRHELLLVGTKGHIPAPAPGTQWPSVIEAPKSTHSAKPDAVYKMIESYFPSLPKLEVFARTVRPGWVSWGAEIPITSPALSPELMAEFNELFGLIDGGVR